jgi:hypothetical protein
MVDWMLGHPFSSADLALDHAALKGDVALVAVGDDFFDTVSGVMADQFISILCL